MCRPRKGEVSPTLLHHDALGKGPAPSVGGREWEWGSGGGREREGEGEAPLFSSHPLLPDIMSLKRMLEKLGVPKTHLELKKLIREVSSGSGETFSYSDFLRMMLGKRSAILKM